MVCTSSSSLLYVRVSVCVCVVFTLKYLLFSSFSLLIFKNLKKCNFWAGDEIQRMFNTNVLSEILVQMHVAVKELDD